MARGGGGRRLCDPCVYFEGGGGILWNSYVTADTQFENSKCPISSICSALRNHQKEKYTLNYVPIMLKIS